MIDKPEIFKPDPFFLSPDPEKRSSVIDELMIFVGDLPLEPYTVKVTKGQELRKDVANRLYYLALGQVSKQIKNDDTKQDENEHDVSVIAGKAKRRWLMPLKPVMAAEYNDDELMEQYLLERKLCDMISRSQELDEYDMWRGYDYAIRSRTLNTKPFARYVNDVLDKFALHGFTIVLNPSERDRALANNTEEQQA